jgi:hypothetical protein
MTQLVLHGIMLIVFINTIKHKTTLLHNNREQKLVIIDFLK